MNLFAYHIVGLAAARCAAGCEERLNDTEMRETWNVYANFCWAMKAHREAKIFGFQIAVRCND